MANVNIDDLPVGIIDDAALFETLNGGVNKQVTGAQIKAYVGSSGGTVTSVSGLSPLFTVSNPTTTPTFALINQNANLVYAGPSTGAAAAPTFRALVAADMPAGVIQTLQQVLDQGSSASIATEIDVTVTGASNSGFFRLHPSQGHEWYYEDTGSSLATSMALNDAGWSVTNNLTGVGITLTTTEVTINNGPLILAADPLVALGAATKQYVDAAVVGLWDDRGNFDASGGAYPSSGGSGTAGAILKGDIWTISVAGTLPTGQVVEAGDTVRALVDTPGNTQANWAIAQNNIGYTPLTSTLASANIFVGNGSNVATAVAVTGDISITNAGVTAYAGTVPVNKGGTNITSYTVGDLIYASGATTLSKLASVAAGAVLMSGGVATAPAWGTVDNGLTTTATTFKWGGALTANTSITGAFQALFNLTVEDGFRVTGSFTAADSFAQAATFAPTVTGRGTSNDAIVGTYFNPTLTNSTGVAVSQIGVRIQPSFTGSVISGPLQTSLQVIGGSSTALTRIIVGLDSAGIERFSLRGDGSLVLTSTLTGTAFAGAITTLTTGNGHILHSCTIPGPSSSGGTVHFQKFTGQFTSNSANTTVHSYWENRTYQIDHTSTPCTISLMLLDPTVTGSQSSTPNRYGIRVATTFLNSFGTTTAADAWVTLGAGTTLVAPLKLTTGTNLTAAVAGCFEYDNTLYFTQSDATRRQVVLATNATKTTAGAPYTNDGYITIRIGGSDVKVMTTA